MEAKFLARIFSIISIFLAISVQADELETDTENEYDSAIYYGDSNVNLGEPFRITCIIPISDPIHWLKDGDSITRHNLRHGRDDHSFFITETEIEGENDKIEAHLSVKHALKVHEGKYQCNSLHTSYHILRVRNVLYMKPHVDMDISLPYTTETNEPKPIRKWSPSSTDFFATNWHEMPSPTTQSMPNNIYNNRTPNFVIGFSPSTQSSEIPTMTISNNNNNNKGRYDYDEVGGHNTPPYYTASYPDYIPTTNIFESNHKMTYFTPSPPQIPPTEISNILHTTIVAPKPIKTDDFLVPNYDKAEHQLKVYEIRYPLVLSCNITKEGDYELLWKKNGTDVSKVAELKDRFKILKAERKFMIERTDGKDAGLYSCEANSEKKDINVVANVAVRLPSNTGVVEGEKLTIHCVAVGTDPKIHWEYGNKTITESTENFVLKADDNQIANAILIMENVSLSDRGEFKCIARNFATEYGGLAPASDVSYVRVKGKLAALWPFLGICAEVLILCTIILIYEKRRNKSDLEESDTDPNEQKKKRRNDYD